MFPGSGRFHCGVEGQEVGLECNFVDHRDDVGDLLAALVDLAHCIDGLLRDGASLVGRVTCRNGQLIGLLGIVGVLFHRRGHFFH